MSSSTLLAVATAVAIFSSASLLQAQSQSTAKTVKPGGSISGRVTVKEKGLAGVVVALRRPEYSPYEMLPRTTTNPEGNYEITNIAPGPYEIIVNALAYVFADLNLRNRSVVIGENEEIENINFSLVRGGVVTGKITDAEGHPVILQQVRLYRADPSDQRPNQQPRTVYPVSTIITDDRGIYRMFGIAAGQYKLATGRSSDNSGFTGNIQRSYKEVFYPDAANITQASVFEVREGSEVTNIDVSLGRPLESFVASGRVLDGDTPVANFRFGLQRAVGERYEFIPSSAMSNSRGEFTVENLIPGKYVIFVYTEPNSEMRAESTTFEIIDSDVSGVLIRLIKGGSISGVVVLESDNKQALAKLFQFQVQGYVQTQSGTPSNSLRATIGPDGSFRLAGLGAGTAQIQVGPQRDMTQMRGFAMSRIERDGFVVQRGLLEIKEGENITGVKIFMNYGTASLRGLINIENGPLPNGARIYVRLTRGPGESPVNLRPINVDERGRFVVDAVPAGSYEVLVSVAGGNSKMRRPVRQQVILQDNIPTDVTITLDLVQDAQP